MADYSPTYASGGGCLGLGMSSMLPTFPLPAPAPPGMADPMAGAGSNAFVAAPRGSQGQRPFEAMAPQNYGGPPPDPAAGSAVHPVALYRPKGITPNNLARIREGVRDVITHLACVRGVLRVQYSDTRTGEGPVFTAPVLVGGASALKFRLPEALRDEEDPCLTLVVATDSREAMPPMGLFIKRIFRMRFMANSEDTADSDRCVHDQQAIQHLRLKEVPGSDSTALYVCLDSKPAVLLVLGGATAADAAETVAVTLTSPPVRDATSFDLVMQTPEAARALCADLIRKGHAGYNALVGLHYFKRAAMVDALACTSEALDPERAADGVLSLLEVLLECGVDLATVKDAISGKPSAAALRAAVKEAVTHLLPSSIAAKALGDLHMSSLMPDA